MVFQNYRFPYVTVLGRCASHLVRLPVTSASGDSVFWMKPGRSCLRRLGTFMTSSTSNNFKTVMGHHNQRRRQSLFTLLLFERTHDLNFHTVKQIYIGLQGAIEG